MGEGLVGEKGNVAENNESISDSIDESSTDDDYDDISISTNYLEENRDGNYIHL